MIADTLALPKLRPPISNQVLRLLSELEETGVSGEGGAGGAGGAGGGVGKGGQSKSKEKLGHFRAAVSVMMKSAQEFVSQAEGTDRRWTRALQHELSIRGQLQENMEKLAKEMHGLEAEARRSFPLQEK